MKRFALVFAGVAFAISASAHAEPPKALYQLTSPDVGQPWHLHAKDGALVCELPCEAWVGARTGDYLVVHDPKKVWRVDLPSTPPSDGAHVSMTARVGKGSPALGALGDVLAVGGAATAVGGIVLLGMSFFNLIEFTAATTYFTIGAPLAISGAIFAVVGLYLRDHNKPASSHIVVTPTAIAGRF